MEHQNVELPKKKLAKLLLSTGGLPPLALSPTKAEGAVSPRRSYPVKTLGPEKDVDFANEALDLSTKLTNGHTEVGEMSAVCQETGATHETAADLSRTEEAKDQTSISSSVDVPIASTTAAHETLLGGSLSKKKARAKKGPSKKKPKAGKKAKRKKNTKKNKLANSDMDFDLDPRLGGSKVSGALKSKGKLKGKNKASGKISELDSRKPTEPRFPYVHVEGSWLSPRVVKFVNGPQKEDEAERPHGAKPTKAAQYIDEEHRSKVAKVGFTSTLSDKYDAQNRDLSWVCVFCQQYTHVQCLGDLYGPYYVNKVEPEPIWHSRRHPDMPAAAHDGPISRGSKRGLKTSGKKRTSSKNDNGPIESGPAPFLDAQNITSVETNPSCSMSQDPDEKTEVWFHENCLVWAPGVYLVPPRLLGLDEAVADSQQAICSHCTKRGANVFCRRRGCGLRSHVPCAFSHQWQLNEETFVALCPSHTCTTAS